MQSPARWAEGPQTARGLGGAVRAQRAGPPNGCGQRPLQTTLQSPPMNITVQTGQLGATESDAIVVNLFQGVTDPTGATGAINQALGGAISRLIATGDFTGRPNQTA